MREIGIKTYYVACAVLLALGFTLLETGPEEITSPLILLSYWGIHISVALTVYFLITEFFSRRWVKRLGGLKVFAGSSILAAAAFSVVSYFLEKPFVAGADLAEMQWADLGTELIHAGPQSLLFWVLINFRFLQNDFAQGRAPKTPPLSDEKAHPPPTSLLGPLQEKITALGRGQPLAIQSEANYIRLRFAGSSELLLYNLKDAVSELEGGMQVHRSHWVLWAAVEQKIYRGRNPYLKLQSDIEVPVGRKYFKEVNERLKQENKA